MSKIHIVGIEGAGTSALAQLYVAAGHTVSGSDDGDGFYRAQLAEIGVELHADFAAENIPADVDLVVYSTAFGDANPEIAAAKARGLTVLAYPEAVAELFNTKMGVSVCGTHGKTTTTALTTEVLAACGRDPQAVIGSQIVGWQGNARVAKKSDGGDVMVLESDEYQNKLRFYNPFAIVLTSLDYDHPDFFPTPESYFAAFEDFIARVPQHGFVVACGDDADVLHTVQQAHCSVITYGFGADNDVQITDVQTQLVDGLPQTTFAVDGHTYTLHIPGAHNVLNATAAIVVAQKLCGTSGEVREKIAQGITGFRGARRRFEYHGLHNGAPLIDDYAHHPTEVRAALAAARKVYPDKNIIAAFHPHTFTRTKALLTEFAQSFDDADQVIVIDVYGSAREEQGGIHSRDLVDAINKTSLGREKAIYIGEISDLAQHAKATLTDSDVFLTLGAGDIWKALPEILEK